MIDDARQALFCRANELDEKDAISAYD